MRISHLAVRVANRDPHFRSRILLALESPKPKYQEFWESVYQNGQKEVPNPRAKTQGKAWKPKVKASTAMKDPAFRKHIEKEFEQWAKSSEREESSGNPKKSNFDYDSLSKRVFPSVKKVLDQIPFFADGGLNKAFDLCGAGPLLDLLGSEPDVNLRFHSEGRTLTVDLNGENVRITRNLKFDEDGKPTSISNTLFRIKKGRGKGKGAEAFAHQVDSARKAGFKKIECDAAGPPDYVGYYVWPVLGYDAKLGKPDPAHKIFSREDREENENFQELQDDYDEWARKMKREGLPQTIQSLFQLEGGREWWKENGWDLDNAEFDLSEGSENLRLLSEYQKSKSG